MPITYEHRVPASTLGGLALAAGQEQYEAQRGREDRARAVQLAQMAQQQQMQNQRMAYDAASTQYRTAADYNKFVMGAQLDVQQRQRDQQNRLALQNNQDQLAAGREEVRWDRAQEVQGQGDTHQAWKGYVDEVRGTLNQDGIDILDTHSAKYRSIMSNQKFSPGQKSAATAQLLEEVQNKNLGQSYAKEIQYEPGKSYVGPKGYKFTVLEDGSHQNLGQNFDDLIKPEEMPDSDWETKGKHVAWLDAHRFGPPGRDKDGRQTHKVEGPDGKLTDVVVEDEQYLNQVLKEEQIEREKEERTATTERRKDKAAWTKDYLDQMNEASPIGEMVGEDEVTPLSPQARLKELEDRRKKARDAADEQFPSRVPAAAAGGGGGGGQTQWPDDAFGMAKPGVDYSRAVSYRDPSGTVKAIQSEGVSRDASMGMHAMPRSLIYGKDPSRLLDADGNPLAPAGGGGEAEPPATSGIPPQFARPPESDLADKQQRMRDTMLKYRDEIDDPQMKGVVDEGIAALDAVIGGAPETPELKQKLRDARKTLEVQKMQTERATEQGSSVEHAETGRFRQQALRRQQALNAGVPEGGTGQMPTPSEGGDEAMHLARPHNPKAWLGGASRGLPASEPMPGQSDPKVPFERTPEQVRAEEDIRALGRRPERIPGSIHERPIGGERTGVERPKGEGHVGAMSGEGAPWQVSRETEAKRKARGEEPYTLEELDKMTRRSYPKGRELSKEEKIKDRIEDPKTAEKTLFTELWPGQGRTDPEWLVKSEGKEGGLWGKDKNAEEIGKIYDHLGEWDLHHPGETKEKFISKFTKSGANIPGKHDPSGYAPKQEAGAKGEKELVSLRAQYVARLTTKLMIKEGRSGYESRFAAAKARQERFERDYREQRKYEDGQGTLTGGRGQFQELGRMKDEFAPFTNPTERHNISQPLSALQQRVRELGLEEKLPDIMKIRPRDLQKYDADSYDRWVRQTEKDVFRASISGQPGLRGKAQGIIDRLKPLADPTSQARRDSTAPLLNELQGVVRAMGLKFPDVLKMTEKGLNQKDKESWEKWTRMIDGVFRENK